MLLLLSRATAAALSHRGGMASSAAALRRRTLTLLSSSSYSRFDFAATTSTGTARDDDDAITGDNKHACYSRLAATRRCRRHWYSSTTALSSSAQPSQQHQMYQQDMFCRQCEQAQDHAACTTVGVCGKTSECAACQDALLAAIKSVSAWCVAARNAGASETDLAAANDWTLAATFATLTNVNFSDDRIAGYVLAGEEIKAAVKNMATAAGQAVPESNNEMIAELDLRGKSVEEIEDFGMSVSVPAQAQAMGHHHQDAFSIKELATYGLKGLCAYALHVRRLLGKDDSTTEIMSAVHEMYSHLSSDSTNAEDWLNLAVRVGEVNGKVLQSLDRAHTDRYGAPRPTAVRTTAVAGKAILVTGHDMVDLHELLRQTAGKRVNVYTHGEMLPAHGYPALSAFDHFVGAYGTAWQNQKFEFAAFPGPIVATTNCVMEPRRVYRDRLYTMNEAGIDGVRHIGPDRDFSNVILQAQRMKGFPKTLEPAQYHDVGYNHRAVTPLVDKIAQGLRSNDISRVLLIGGCDGSQWNRSYFTELAEEAVAENAVVLTMGCAKNRVIRSPKLLELQEKGDMTIGSTGLPRVLDMGQCNDSLSAMTLAAELARTLQVDNNNEVPFSIAWSHMEQKAIACLLTMLASGFQNVRLGPTLPAYLTPGALRMLQDRFHFSEIGTVENDLKDMMRGA